MRNQKNYNGGFYENDNWNRFKKDAPPPTSSADWGWLQHILASLNEAGRAAVVLDTGAVSRGSGSKSSNKEKTLRQHFVENDWIEGVVLLPENLFYNTTAPGIILLLNRRKAAERRQQIILINASAYFVKEKAEECVDGGGDRRRRPGIPAVGKPRKVEPGHYPGGGAGSGLQPQPVVICGCGRGGDAPAVRRDFG